MAANQPRRKGKDEGIVNLRVAGRIGRRRCGHERHQESLCYPGEIISHAVWLCFRFTLSYRDVEELLASRGLIVPYETIRQWYLKFGQAFTSELCRRAPRRGDK